MVFGFLLTNICTANYDDPLAEERDAPPKPLPIQFPEYCPVLKSTPLTKNKHTELKKLLIGIKNPAELTPKFVEAFNVKYRSNVAIADLVPDVPDGLLEEAALNTIIKDEFLLENEPCFRKVCRLSPEKGQTLPRLSQAYLFYKQLEEMSRYWDNSKDSYFTKIPTTAPSQPLRNPLRSSTQKENVRPQDFDANGDTYMTNSTPQTPPNTNSPTPQNLYTGRRNGNAANMPPQMRDGALEGFLRAATQKFNTVCKPPAQQYTRLQVGNCLIPMRQTCVVGRVPSDRAEARKAKTCGPMMVGSSRGEVVFRREGESVGQGQGEVADFLRELGGLLLLAQQRDREGRAEVRPGSGEDAWWARKERWGGGVGGKMPHEEQTEMQGVMEEFPAVADKDFAMRDMPNGHTRAKRSLDISVAKDDDKGDVAPVSKYKCLPGIEANANIGTAPTAASSHDTPIATDKSTTSSSSTPIIPSATSNAPAPSRSRPTRPPMSSRRVKVLAESWKIIRVPSALWDPNTMYQAIGRPDGHDGEWDNVFMISSVNTHVCLLKMKVSREYLGWLEGGVDGEQMDVDVKENGDGEAKAKERRVGRSGISLPVEEERDWNGEIMRGEILYVERSAWWDLFVPAERVEALKVLWQVLSWLSREVGSGGGKVFGSVE